MTQLKKKKVENRIYNIESDKTEIGNWRSLAIKHLEVIPTEYQLL